MNTEAVVVGIIWGAIYGVGVGLIPLIVGAIRKETTYAIAGFFASFVCGATAGLVLAVPIAGVFTILSWSRSS